MRKLTIFTTFTIIIVIIIFNANNSFAQKVEYNVESITSPYLIKTREKETLFLKDIYIPEEKQSEALNLLKKNMLNKKINITHQSDFKDRNHFIHSQIVTNDGFWPQEQLLKNGIGYYYNIMPTNHSEELMNFEYQARKNKLGIWQYAKIINANNWQEISINKQNLLNKFVIIRGKVRSYNKINNGKIYINFSKFWTKGIHVFIKKKNISNFKNYNFDDLIDKKLEARGWLEEQPSPAIEIFTPENLIFPDVD